MASCGASLPDPRGNRISRQERSCDFVSNIVYRPENVHFPVDSVFRLFTPDFFSVEPILHTKWKEIISLEDISFHPPTSPKRVPLRGHRVLSEHNVVRILDCA